MKLYTFAHGYKATTLTDGPLPFYSITEKIDEDSQEVVALVYLVKVPERDYEPLKVQVKETRPAFTKEDLAIRRQKGLKTFVSFEGFVARPFAFLKEGQLISGVSATASNAVIYDEKGTAI